MYDINQSKHDKSESDIVNNHLERLECFGAKSSEQLDTEIKSKN